MKRVRRTKKTFRDCLVCGTLNSTAHMGIDVCRACSIFYRRSLERQKPFACRSGTIRCPPGKGLNCRRCRLHHIEKALKVSMANRDESSSDEPETFHSEYPTITLAEFPGNYQAPILQLEMSSSNAAAIHAPSRGMCDACSMPLLTKVKTAYDKLCFARLVAEQFNRKDPDASLQMSTDIYPVYPATFTALNKANRILMTCILEFGANAFPEFVQLSDDEKLAISTKFFYTFRILDQSYREMKRFPNGTNRNFAGYTLYLSEQVVEHFFDDYDNDKGDLEEAKRFLLNSCRSRPKRGSHILDKMLPDHTEFCALLVLLFWATFCNLYENAQMEWLFAMKSIKSVTNTSSKFPASCTSIIGDRLSSIVSSFHMLSHRDVLHLDDYAMRLGELFSSLPVFEAHNKIKESFEVFRLLDIFSDDTFTYKLAK
ncbi:hypothetical protein PRIPAC_81015 [Pristionchus pacificus]|uniref:Nuclear receptor n=1 Tax=Pristionchus pacificus TaxID=54126 RepID=A0A2A6CQI2_PRIPA|nr:hypothetical protein PRIPAC_81015 [Pristionchus pacificus]|eukprot:PDM80356.1 nuclear receptor [Pristionchus pacificus]